MLFSGHPSPEDRRCACGGLARLSLALADDSRRPRASCDPAFNVPSSALPSSSHLSPPSHILVSYHQVDVVSSLRPVSRSSHPRSRIRHSADGVEQRIQGSEFCVAWICSASSCRCASLAFSILRLSTPPDRWASASRQQHTRHTQETWRTRGIIKPIATSTLHILTAVVRLKQICHTLHALLCHHAALPIASAHSDAILTGEL
jgi:hypothetical protein